MLGNVFVCPSLLIDFYQKGPHLPGWSLLIFRKQNSENRIRLYSHCLIFAKSDSKPFRRNVGRPNFQPCTKSLILEVTKDGVTVAKSIDLKYRTLRFQRRVGFDVCRLKVERPGNYYLFLLGP